MSDDADRDAESFSVYVSADIEPQRALEMVQCDYSEDDDTAFEIHVARGLTTQQICQQHRQRAVAGGKLYTTLFLVVDSDQSERGVLAVNLKPYHGYPDAVRHEGEDAGNALASLSISNTDWYDERNSVDGRNARVPEDWFALYDLGAKDFDHALKTMNDGVQEVNVDQDNADNAVDGPPFGLAKKYHRGVEASGSLDGLIAGHAALATTQDLDPKYLAVADDKFEESALIVRVEPRDSFRCKHPTAGEILGWIYINFMTWEEAKEFAGQQ